MGKWKGLDSIGLGGEGVIVAISDRHPRRTGPFQIINLSINLQPSEHTIFFLRSRTHAPVRSLRLVSRRCKNEGSSEAGAGGG